MEMILKLTKQKGEQISSMKKKVPSRRKHVRRKLDFYHLYFKKSGLYRFFYKNIFKLIAALIMVFLLIYLAKVFLPNIEETMEVFFQKFNKFWVLAVFYISESLLGLIPPDFFIAWSSSMEKPWEVLTLLALFSYMGGITSYSIGKWLGKIPRIERYVVKKFINHFQTIKKWGGFMIVFAALFPIPYSAACMAAGIIRYPFVPFLLLGLFRFARFYAYAVLIFKAINL